jgi:hypothetical protein
VPPLDVLLWHEQRPTFAHHTVHTRDVSREVEVYTGMVEIVNFGRRLGPNRQSITAPVHDRAVHARDQSDKLYPGRPLTCPLRVLGFVLGSITVRNWP